MGSWISSEDRSLGMRKAAGSNLAVLASDIPADSILKPKTKLNLKFYIQNSLIESFFKLPNLIYYN
jgi:hypothetical protein